MKLVIDKLDQSDEYSIQELKDMLDSHDWSYEIIDEDYKINKEKLLLHIKKLKNSGEDLYVQDAKDMTIILKSMEIRNYDIASTTYLEMDTIVRDDFVEKLTNNYKDKEAMKELSEKLGFEWIGSAKEFIGSGK